MPLGANKAAIMGVAGVSTADVVLLSTQTASGDSELDFSSDITSTYGEYIFRFYNMNPATDGMDFLFQVNAAGESDFDETITSTFFVAYHDEANTVTGLAYQTGSDQAQGTAYQRIVYNALGNLADESGSGEFHLFNPASTTYVKHFYSTMQANTEGNYSVVSYAAGYINTTAAIDQIQFKMGSGNFDGTIKMWGVK